MKLKYFRVTNYRSIRHAILSDVQSTAILIGPNNEGKSNILQALRSSLSILSSGMYTKTDKGLKVVVSSGAYDWSQDYPIQLQETDPEGHSVFVLHFQLSDEEKAEFYTHTGSSLNGLLPIELKIGPSKMGFFRVKKQGKGSKALTNKAQLISSFIGQTLDFAYVPSSRNSNASESLVSQMVKRELKQLERNPKYTAATKILEELEQPMLDGIATKLKGNLQNFLGPTFKSVSVSASSPSYLDIGYGRSVKITIDDGAPTLLQRKGDGVQSLVAISLIVGALQEKGIDKDIILLVEEPESHLHPNAVHQLSAAIDDLRSADHQVILTTHSPVFVNRASIGTNIIVSNSNASAAKSLRELRDVLGVRASDNLQHAALVLVVEGSDDKLSTEALLAERSPRLKKALAKGELALHSLYGASKLTYTLSMLETSLCNFHVLLDDDAEGRKALVETEKQRLTTPAMVTRAINPYKTESEFEDLLNEGVYAEYFKKMYSRDIGSTSFKAKTKWSTRIRSGLLKSGHKWTEEEEYRDKRAIAELVAGNPSVAIHTTCDSVIDSLARSLEIRLESLA